MLKWLGGKECVDRKEKFKYLGNRCNGSVSRIRLVLG
jgi:hypothetical protein